MKYLRFTAALFVLAVFAAGAPARAQKGESKLRTVHGTVVNKDDGGVPSAIIYLKNNRTQTVQTHIADESGRYRFSGLDPNVDYEIHAESGELTSTTRAISSFDGRKEIDYTLKLDKQKKKIIS